MAGHRGAKVIKRMKLTGEIVAIYPSVKVAAAVEGVCEESVREWCRGTKKQGDILHSYEYQKDGKQTQKAPNTNQRDEGTLCWVCANYYANCPWTIDFTPVPGWKAERTVKETRNKLKDGTFSVKEDEFYRVIDCPLFVEDPPRKKAKPVPDHVREAVADAFEKRLRPKQPVKPPKNTYDVELCQECEMLAECRKDRLVCKKRVRWPNI